MEGPPLEIHLDPNACPRYVSTPSTVPLHWQDKVKADIDRDVRMSPRNGATAWLLYKNTTAPHAGASTSNP